MRKLSVLLVTLTVVLTLAAAPANKSVEFPAAAKTAMNNVDAANIRAHVKFLSDDLLEGRGTGQRGGDIAAAYIAAQFELAHLKPAGDNGSYLQTVPMMGIATQSDSTVSLEPAGADPIKLKLRDDIVAMDETGQTASDLDADLVFVGYGIEAPEYKWDDYKGTDVRGKVLVMLVNEPPSEDATFFKGKALTYYGRWTYKFEEAARKGAVGALVLHKSDMASYGWNVVQTSWSGERSYLRGENQPKLKMAAWIQYDIGNKLAALSGKSIDQWIEMAKSRDFKPILLAAKLKAHMVSTVRPFDSHNVVAMLPGSDPKLKNEAVMYTAHWDHLGMRAGMPGDNIYNGAIDNATGCAVLMEMARAFATAPARPKRTIIFASVTAEEQGLRGSEYLALHPPIPAGKIGLGLNFDGLAPIGVPEQIEAHGAERTQFYPVLEQTAKEFGFTIAPDSNPGAGSYYRSDHFSMARVGIPAFSVNQGQKFEGKPVEYGETFDKEYTKNNYHQPSDEFHPDWDFSGNAKMARFGIALGWKAAEQPSLMGWQAGDEFEPARKASMGAGK
jgi:Zn-dependent M28 family amino/carboxypeptidase